MSGALTLVYITLYGILTIWIFFANLASIVVFMRFKHLQRKEVTVILDLATSVWSTGLKLYGKAIHFSHNYCRLFTLFEYASSCGTILHLLAIAVERYLAVMYPFRYEVLVTSHRIKIVVAFIWFVILLLSLMPVWTVEVNLSDMCFHVNGIPLSFSASFLALNLVLLTGPFSFLYGRICVVARSHLKRITVVSNSLDVKPASGDQKLTKTMF